VAKTFQLEHPLSLSPCILHRDEAFWGDPDVFRPERFLDDAGKLLPADHPRRKRLMPFGAGSRVCVGEIFALRRLFIFLVSVAQAFDLGPGDKLVTCKWEDYDNGLLLRQKPFTLRLTARQ
jgi:cytochrome P450